MQIPQNKLTFTMFNRCATSKFVSDDALFIPVMR